jgi:LAO/AO transport system ATPase
MKKLSPVQAIDPARVGKRLPPWEPSVPRDKRSELLIFRNPVAGRIIPVSGNFFDLNRLERPKSSYLSGGLANPYNIYSHDEIVKGRVRQGRTRTIMLGAMLERFRRGDRLALARLISLVARGEQIESILAGVGEPRKPARVVAVTGSGGVGKSTLAGKLIEEERRHGLSVAVLACDPQSPLSGGALLGDRFRMSARPDDEGIFIRSLAAAGGHGALAEHLPALIRLVEAFGFDVVLIETVGAGQGDTVVRELVDILVLLLQPETGDDLQWEKAGLLEVADVIVIHKADLPGAERVEAQVLAMLALGTGAVVPVLRVSSRTGNGLEELWQTIASRPLRRGRRQDGRDLLRLAQQTLAARFAAAEAGGQPDVRRLLDDWQRGTIPSTHAASALLTLLREGAEASEIGPASRAGLP